MFLLGTDRLGRDMLSRLIYGARISLTVGLIGVTLSFILGITIGGLAGYFGGKIDYVVAARDRDPPLAAGTAAVAGALGRAAGDLEPAPGLFRHHRHPGAARLAGPGARRPLEAAGAARGGFRLGRRDDGRQAVARHRPAPPAELHQPPDRLGLAVDPVA